MRGWVEVEEGRRGINGNGKKYHKNKLINKNIPSYRITKHIKKINELTLAGVAQWIELQPVNQRVAGSIPSQSTCLGYRPGPQYGAHERQPHIDVSLPLFPSLL